MKIVDFLKIYFCLFTERNSSVKPTYLGALDIIFAV